MGLPKSTERFALPDKVDTLRLIETYFSTTGVLFPYIDRTSFLNAYHQFSSSNVQSTRRSWLGLLNMVLAMAINAGHESSLTASERAAKSDVYFRRASALCEKLMRQGTSLELGPLCTTNFFWLSILKVSSTSASLDEPVLTRHGTLHSDLEYPRACGQSSISTWLAFAESAQTALAFRAGDSQADLVRMRRSRSVRCSNDILVLSDKT